MWSCCVRCCILPFCSMLLRFCCFADVQPRLRMCLASSALLLVPAACCCNALLFCSVYCCVAACLHCFDVVWRMGSLSHGLLRSCCAMPLSCWAFPSCPLFAAFKKCMRWLMPFCGDCCVSLACWCVLVRFCCWMLLSAAFLLQPNAFGFFSAARLATLWLFVCVC